MGRRFVLAVLLLGNFLAELSFRREKSPVYNLKCFIVFGFGQRFLPQAVLKSLVLNPHFSTAASGLTSRDMPK